MAKMTVARARSLIGQIVLAQLDREPDPRGIHDEAARSRVIGWLVAALDTGQLKEMAALLTIDFLSWPAMRKGTLEGRFPGYRAGVPPTVPRTATDDGRHLTARTLCQPDDDEEITFQAEALAWPLPPGSDKGPAWDDLEATRAALLGYLEAITWGPSSDTRDELKALIERIGGRLFEVGSLIVAGYNEAVDEMAKEREAFDKLPPSPPDDDDLPF
jgi:hypothetical protein